MLQTTDFVLVQATLQDESLPALTEAGARFCAQSPLPMTMHRLAWSAEARTAYLYGRLLARTVLDAEVLSSLRTLFQRLVPGAVSVRVSRLERVFEIDGHSRAATPAFHYVVEMDPDAGWMPEISRWYDTEHMPGLAAVPGCIRALRLINHDQGPLSLACYDLVSPQTLGSPPWLAVRGTAWSDITRPHFTNTQRTMFEVMA
jgi:hypothetical protein